MDLAESFKILRRHKWVTSGLLTLTLVGTAGGAVALPWSYQAESQVVLLNSSIGSEVAGGNPYLAFDPSLTQTANVLCLAMMDSRTAQDLSAHGYPAGYQVAVNSNTGGSVIQITATGSNAAEVVHTLTGVTDEASQKLQQLQAGIPARNRINSSLLSMQPKASKSLSKKAKPLVVILAVGLVLTFAVPQLMNGLLDRRERRRGARASAGLRDQAGPVSEPADSYPSSSRGRAASREWRGDGHSRWPDENNQPAGGRRIYR